MLMHSHRAASQAGSPTYRFNLQTEVLKADRVVPVHRALELQREDEIQISAAPGYKRAARLRRPHLKAAIELRDVVFSEKGIGPFQSVDPMQPQHLRQTMGIDSSSYLGSEPEMAAPVAVQGAEHTFPLNHFFQPRHHRQGRFFFHQLRVIDLAAGIIQNHNQVIPALVLEPAMPAAIDVQQHAGQRPPRPPLTMHPAFSSARYQSRSLQGLFHPAVAELDLMVGHQLLVKMPHVQIVIPLAIESQHLLHHPQRDSLRRRPTPPAIKQSVIAELLVTLPPAPHVPVTDANNFRRLPPRDLLRHCPQYHFLYFHRPLHRGLRIRNHASHGLLSSPPEKRTYHVLSQPDISCTNDKLSAAACSGAF